MIKEQKITEESIKRISKVSSVLEKYAAVKAVYLFGSLALGRYNSLSDIDLAYLSQDKIDDIENLHYDLCCFLKTEEVDFINLKKVPLSNKYEIISHGKLVYCSDQEYLADFKENVYLNYFDFLPYLKEYHTCFVENMRG